MWRLATGMYFHSAHSLLVCHDFKLNRIWMMDLARTLGGNVKFDGFDISLDQCLPLAWLPDNIDIHTWDLFKEPPSEFIEAFDVVHIRLITVAVKDNDPRPILANLRKLLSEFF